MKIRTHFTKKENIDSGLALILSLILLFLLFKIKLCLIISIAILVLLMINASSAVYPFTIFWLNLSHYLGTFMSKVVLTVIFFLFVVPLAFARKIMGKDSLKLKLFKKSKESVFHNRNYTYSHTDIENPF